MIVAVSEAMLSKEALERLADQAVSDELVHLLANTDIQTGQHAVKAYCVMSSSGGATVTHSVIIRLP